MKAEKVHKVSIVELAKRGCQIEERLRERLADSSSQAMPLTWRLLVLRLPKSLRSQQ
jgi:hypothetical protein